MIALLVISLFISDEVEVRNGRFTSELVDQLALPEQHNVLLMLHSFLNLSGEVLSCFLFLDLVDFPKGATSQLLNDLVPLFQDLLPFL